MNRASFLPIAVATLALAAASPAAAATTAAKPAAKSAKSAKTAPAPRMVLPFVEDDYQKALHDARARGIPIFIEAWAPW